MRPLTELYIDTGTGETRGRSPSSAAIHAFESWFGHKLPEEYLQLLAHANGGSPELSAVVPTGKTINESWDVDHFYSLDEDEKSEHCLWRIYREWRKVLGNQLLPFASDGGGNQFCLDFRDTPPSIKVCIHDEGYAIVTIARSFADFIDAMTINPEYI